MPGMFPERNPDLDYLIAYIPLNPNVVDEALFRATDLTDTDDDDEEMVEFEAKAVAQVEAKEQAISPFKTPG